MINRTSRPALQAAGLYAAGILIAHWRNLPPGPLLALALFSLFLSLIVRPVPRVRRTAPWLLATALLLTACLQYECRTRLYPPHHICHLREAQEPLTLSGRVVSDAVLKGSDAVLILEVAAIENDPAGLQASGRVLLTVKEFCGQLAYGDDVRLSGRLRTPRGARNPGEFDYRAYLDRRCIHGQMSVHPQSILEVRPGRVGWFPAMVGGVRRHLHVMISQTLPDSPGALLCGVLLGERRNLPPEITGAFSDAGVIHVLAVSGLHVGLIGGMFFALFRTFRLREALATLLALGLLLCYMYVVDLRPSVVRATIMASVVMLGRLLERETDLLNGIAFAGLVILIWTPQYLFDLGFQLSFTATFSIVYLHGRLRELLPASLADSSRRWVSWTISGLLVSLSAQLGTAPIVAHYFGKVNTISVLANLLVVPLVGLTVGLGFTTALVGLISMTVAKLYATANWLLLTVLIKLVTLIASLPWACLRVPQPGNYFWCLYYGFLLLGASAKRSSKARRVFLFSGLCLLNLLVWRGALQGPADLSVLFFDVGQGDAALVRFPNGRTMLVDGGERKATYDCGDRVVCPCLRRIGLDRIDVVVLTHADNDHVGGLPAVLEQFPVGMVLDSGARHLSATYMRFLTLSRDPPGRYREVRAGDQVEICQHVEVEVLHPTDAFVTDQGDAAFGLNNASVVLRVQYGTVSFLLTGDIEEEAEKCLLHHDRLTPSTVLKVPHHGSLSSSTRPFLLAIRPQLAVISAGQANRFGHPHPDVLQRYGDLDIAVYRTDEDGAVWVETDGRKLRAKTFAGHKTPLNIFPWKDLRAAGELCPDSPLIQLEAGTFSLTSPVRRVIMSTGINHQQGGKNK